MTAAAPARSTPAAGAPRARLTGGDAVRAVATIGVICIHASAWGPRASFQPVDHIARFSVPAFMILTGVLLAYQYTGRPTGVPFLRRRVSRSVLPWLAWAPIYIAFDIVTGSLSASTSDLFNFLGQGAGHLWFLLLIPQLYLLFIVWPQRRPWALALAALLLQTALCLIRIYVVLPGWQSQVMLTYATLIFPFWIGYFAIGVALGLSLRRPGRLRRAAVVWRGRLAVGAAAAAAGSAFLLLNLHYPGAPYAHSFLNGTGEFLNPVLPLFVCSASAFVALVVPPLMARVRLVARAVSLVSDQSLGVYIVHPILLFLWATFVLQPWFTESSTMATVAAALLIVLTLLSALLVVRLITATPAAPTLGTPRRPLRIGVQRRPQRRAA